MKITCIISSLGGGGAERSILNLADFLAKRGYDVTLLTLRSDIPDAYTVPPSINRVYATQPLYGWQRWYDLKGQIKRIQRRWYTIRNLRSDILKTEPDLIISFIDQTNILVLQVMLGKNIPIIISERSDPRFHQIGIIWNIFRHIFYPLAYKVIVQTEEVHQWVKNNHFSWQVVHIPNPILLDTHHLNSPKPLFFKKSRNIIAVGRLAPVKQFDLLLEAFAMIAPQFLDWQLTILGEGEQRQELQKKIDELNIQDQVQLPGRIPEPTKILIHSDLFVLTSKYEGFPNALLEAMACGLPAVSFDCPCGPRAIIRHNIDGVLIPLGDVKQLSIALSDLMKNDSKRKQFSTKAREVLQRFSAKVVIDQWEKIIMDNCSKATH